MMGTLRSSNVGYLALCIIYLCFIIKCNDSSHCKTDPCVEITLTLSQNESRTENCPDVQYSNCDVNITAGWYKIDTPMLNHCPTNALGYSCGTTFPAWMNGTEPLVSDGVVDRVVCLKTAVDCCEKTYYIQVKKCTTFIAYCLQPLVRCPERYCFGTFGTCLSTTTTTITIPTTTTIIASSTTEWEPAEIIPGLKTNASDDGGYNTDLKDPHVGYVLIGLVCSLIIVAAIILMLRCRRHIPMKQKLTFHVSTNERTPSTTHICVSEVEESTEIHMADFSNNKTARFHPSMET